MKHQPSNRRKPLTYNANLRVSESLTDLVIQEIQLLPKSTKNDYLNEVFLSKFVSTETDPAPVRRNRAISKWLSVERDNEATNDRLFLLHEEYNILPRVSWNHFRDVVRETIVSLIGETVPVEALIGSFSGGASTSRKRTESHPASKYLGQADITSAALPWFRLAIEHMEGWGQFHSQIDMNVVPGNALFTVPKTAIIDRCACKEPDLNMFLQKGVGNHLRKALLKKGINLNDQTRNQSLAKEGSISGVLATMDLSSASDSVSTELVYQFLPPLWFDLLSSLRCPVTDIDGECHVNEMFSSMGNGFTFELESLLFYSIAKAVARCTGTPGVISVYGDDIICPSSMFTDLAWVLGVLGFGVNASKSFHTGSFRESCGGHYHNGYDITPFFLRKPITHLTDLIQVANAIRKWSNIDGLGVLDPDLEELWLFLSDLVPRKFWGGIQLGSITRLVSPHAPCQQLVAFVDTKDNLDGGYIHWLNLTDSRSIKDTTPRISRLYDAETQGCYYWSESDLTVLCDDGVSTSFRTITGTKYRERPVRKNYSNWFDGPQFLTELETDAKG